MCVCVCVCLCVCVCVYNVRTAQHVRVTVAEAATDLGRMDIQISETYASTMLILLLGATLAREWVSVCVWGGEWVRG